MTVTAYPLFHSAIALMTWFRRKTSKAAQDEYKKELMLFPLPATTSGTGLVDTLQLAEAYAKPDARDMVQAIWFYARAWNFAPPAYKAQIEPKLEYWYKRFHGNLEGLDAVKTASASDPLQAGYRYHYPGAHASRDCSQRARLYAGPDQAEP